MGAPGDMFYCPVVVRFVGVGGGFTGPGEGMPDGGLSLRWAYGQHQTVLLNPVPPPQLGAAS